MRNNVIQNLPPRVFIGKAGISAVTMEDTLEVLDSSLRKAVPAYVCVANIQTVVVSQSDAEFCEIVNHSLLTVPDGMPVVWYAGMAGTRGIERVTGPDLMIEVLRRSAERGYTHYFYGDTDETLDRIASVVHERFPGATIVGMYSPPFRPLTQSELDATVEEINELNPSFVWVGLGCPKQEVWIGRVSPRIRSSVLVGVGAAFRFLIGEYRHPPKVFQMCGLEGVFWRGLRRPVYSVKYWARYVPPYGSLFLKGLTKRLTDGGRRARSASC